MPVQGSEPGQPSTPAQQGPPGEVVFDNQGHDRAYWRRRLEALQAQLRQAQGQRKALLEQLAPEEQRQAFGRRGVEVLRQTQALERLERDMRGTEAALQVLRQDAAQAGAPAEWLQ